jgi:cytochrome c553
MKSMLKRIGLALLAVLVLVLAGGGVYAWTKVSAYDASLDKVYPIPPLDGIARSSDPAVFARGKHLVASLAACGLKDCHGPDLGGGRVTAAGPIGSMQAPNITQILPAYSDGELARLIRHGVKKDQRTVRFMSMNEVNWMTDADLVAVISYVRSVPKVDRPSGSVNIGWFGKVMDRLDNVPIDVARRIRHDHIEIGPTPSPTPEYGKWIARVCTGCHGDHLSGGKIPGTPPDFPIPLNLTPDATGLKGWTLADFKQRMAAGTRKDGRKLADFMPTEALNAMDDVERQALFSYLQSVPPLPFGQR